MKGGNVLKKRLKEAFSFGLSLGVLLAAIFFDVVAIFYIFKEVFLVSGLWFAVLIVFVIGTAMGTLFNWFDTAHERMNEDAENA